MRALAPHCQHCGCVVIGHGVEASGRFFSCAHEAGVTELADRIGPPVA
jgi:Rieske Fe-S protein